MGELFDKYLTPAWRQNLMDESFWEQGVGQLPDRELWEVHHLQKETLIQVGRVWMREQLARHGGSPDELCGVDSRLDPRGVDHRVCPGVLPPTREPTCCSATWNGYSASCNRAPNGRSSR